MFLNVFIPEQVKTAQGDRTDGRTRPPQTANTLCPLQKRQATVTPTSWVTSDDLSSQNFFLVCSKPCHACERQTWTVQIRVPPCTFTPHTYKNASNMKYLKERQFNSGEL